jgi:GntR family transcriptional regulator
MVGSMPIEDNSGLTRGSASIHQQLAERLRAQVSQMTPDSQIPTENELVSRYGVSRTTVRRALSGLVEEGLLVRRQGAGTFVAPRRIVHPLDQLRPFISIFASVGKHPEGQILRFEWASEPQLPPQVAHPVDGALMIRRLYTIDGAPQAVADIAVPDPFGQRISRAEIEEHPIYQVLQDKLGLTLSYGQITLTSQSAPEDLAQPLGIATGHPLLVLQRATMDADDRLLEHATYYLLPDRFELRLTVGATELEKVSYSFSRPGPELVMLAQD